MAEASLGLGRREAYSSSSSPHSYPLYCPLADAAATATSMSFSAADFDAVDVRSPDEYSVAPFAGGDEMMLDEVYGSRCRRLWPTKSLRWDPVDAAAARGGAARSSASARIGFRTRSEVEVMDDGFKWRKYGKKAVKSSPNPRSYYRCSSEGCGVKKRVERDGDDPRDVLTTYDGVHNHASPGTAGHAAAPAAAWLWTRSDQPPPPTMTTSRLAAAPTAADAWRSAAAPPSTLNKF